MRPAAKRKEANLKRFRQRLVLVVAFFGLTISALVVRAVNLQVIDQEFLADQADARHVRISKLSAHRGSITDRNGEPLAVSTPVDSIWANPQLLGPAVDEMHRLARMLGVDAETLMRKISRGAGKEFVYLRRHLAPNRAAQVLDLELPGVEVQREYRRFYPAGEVTGHLIGFTDIDDTGLEGLEYAYNAWLKGESGAKRVIKDSRGRVIEDVESIRAARPGQELRASIDLRLQYLAYRELKRAINEHDAISGSVVILDIQTGEVLAIVNQPGFNPNDRAQYNVSRYRNRSVTDLLEPGSSVKPFIVAAALESSQFEPASAIDTTPGWIKVGPKRIADKRNLGRLSLTEIIARSSNVGITKLAMRLESDQLWDVMTRFGFGALTSSNFPGESTGFLSHFNDWRPISQATLAYGYGISVTPLQLARAYAAVGAGGILRPVSLVRVDQAVPGERIIAKSTADAVLAMMEQVVSNVGTGSKADVVGYRVAGKTGTAWKFTTGGYSQNKYLSIFAGVAPAANPRLATVVVVDEPSRDDYYGGDVAAPIFSRVMTESLRLLAITPDDLPRAVSSGELSASMQ